MAVAQTPVDQGEEFAGSGDLADVGAAPFTDSDTGATDRAAPLGLYGFDRGPSDRSVALLGDSASMDLRVGLVA